MGGFINRSQKSIERGQQVKRSFNAKQGKGCGIFKNATD